MIFDISLRTLKKKKNPLREHKLLINRTKNHNWQEKLDEFSLHEQPSIIYECACPFWQVHLNQILSYRRIGTRINYLFRKDKTFNPMVIVKTL